MCCLIFSYPLFMADSSCSFCSALSLSTGNGLPASIPIVAITAFAMKGDEERIREGGCEAYLSKPISVAKFLETVKTYAG